MLMVIIAHHSLRLLRNVLEVIIAISDAAPDLEELQDAAGDTGTSV